MKKDAAQPDQDNNHQDGGYQKNDKAAVGRQRHRQSGADAAAGVAMPRTQTMTRPAPGCNRPHPAG